MANSITVNICGEEYTFTAEESPSYMQKVAALVDEKMSAILQASKVNHADAAVLTAVNIADEYLKALAGSENLRSQIKDYLDEANRAKAEVSELKRDVLKLKRQLEEKA